MQDKDGRSGSTIQKFLIPVFFGALLALGSCCLLLLASAGFVFSGILPESIMVKVCIVLLALCAMFGGRYAVKRGEGAPMLLGAVTGIILCILLLGIAYMGYEHPQWQGNGLWLFLAAMVGACFSGLTKQPRRARAKKRKKH